MNATSQRVMIWAGMLLSGVYTVGFAFLMNLFPLPPPLLGVEEVVHLYTQNNLQFLIGAALMMVSGCFMLPWVVVLYAQMSRYEKGTPVWAILQGMAGTLQTGLFIVPPFFWGLAAFSPQRDPGLTVMLHEAGFISFIVPICTMTLVVIPVSVICFMRKSDTHSAFPRWLGYIGLLQATEGQLGVMALLFKSGPFAWNGLFPFFLPVGLFGAWITPLLFLLLRAIRHQEMEATG